MSRLPRCGRAILGTGLGAGAAFALSAHLWGLRLPPAVGLVLLAGLALGLAALLDRRLLPWLGARLGERRPGLRLRWLGGAVLLATLLLRALPLVTPRDAGFELVATGTRNARAQGSTVQVLAAHERQGGPIPLGQLERSGAWELHADGGLLFPGGAPATLRYRGQARGGLTFLLKVSPDAGVVRVSREGAHHSEDLYRASPGQLRVLSTASALRAPPLARFVFHAAHLTCLATLLLALGLWAASREGTLRPVPLAAHERWVYALPPLLAWSTWLLLLFPGLMTSDSVDQWAQAERNQLSDFHPIFHTFLFWLLQQVWRSPAMVAAVQIVLLSALVGWGCACLRQAGAPRWAAWLSALLLALSPLHGAMAITLWKDIPFGIAVLTLCLLLLRVSEDRRWRHTDTTLLLVAGLLALLVRHNGAPVVLGTYAGLLLLRRQEWRRWAIALLVTLVLGSGIHALLARHYQAPPMKPGFALLGVLGAHVAGGTPLQPEERSLLADIHSLEDRWRYDCASNVPTIWGGGFKPEGFDKHHEALGALAVRLTLRNPGPVLAHVRCASSMLWKLSPGGDAFNGPAVSPIEGGGYTTIHAAEGAPRPAPPFPELARGLVALLNRTLQPSLVWLLWRPALPLYLVLLAAFAACLRGRSARPLLVLLPLLVHTAVLAPLIPSPDVRYQYPAFLVAMLFAPAWLATQRRRSEPQQLPAAPVPAEVGHAA